MFYDVHSESRRQIYKIQLPIATNDPEPLVLFYNQDRSIVFYLPLTSAIADQVGNSPKSFWYGWIKATKFVFDGEAPWQDW